MTVRPIPRRSAACSTVSTKGTEAPIESALPARRTPDRCRARPSRPLYPRTHHRAGLANPSSPSLAFAAETGEHPLRHLLTAASGRDLRTADDMAAVLDWRLPELTPTNPGPLPWLPGIPPPLHDHPVWGTYLAKRSRVVADPRRPGPTSPLQSDRPPAWAAAGAHPTALIRESAVWRAANGIDPQDPRPTGGGGQLETAAALWKQRLDRHIARSTDSSGNERSKERQAAHTARSRWHNDNRRPYQTPGQRPNGLGAPGR
jgi:hypothetical protein